jgi:hypothetical protein
MSTLGFEATPEDLANVLERFGCVATEDELQEMFESTVKPHLARIEAAALDAVTSVDDEETLAAQTRAAEREIMEILYEGGLAGRKEANPPKPSDPPKTTIIVVKSNDDFWILLHQPKLCEIVEFRYYDEGNAANSTRLVKASAQFFGAEPDTIEITADDLRLDWKQIAKESGPTMQWFIRTPNEEGKVFTGDSETECLVAMLQYDPDAIVNTFGKKKAKAKTSPSGPTMS